MERSELYEAVRKRRSVRKYSDKLIEKEKAEQLRNSISVLNGKSNLTMEYVDEYGSFRSILTIMFKGVRSAVIVKGRTDDPDLREKCGYYGEEIVLEATALGLGTCWVAGFNKKSRSLNIGTDETAVCVIPVGYGIEPVPGTAPDAPHRKTRSASELLNGETDVPEWVLSAMPSVQFAPTAMNRQRARFSCTGGSVSVEIPPGDLNMVDLGITKLHFELAAGGRFELGSPAKFVKDA